MITILSFFVDIQLTLISLKIKVNSILEQFFNGFKIFAVNSHSFFLTGLSIFSDQ